jgi:8-oxo-dGTP diphosphatase
MKKVTAAILRDNGKILVAKRPDHDKLAGYWEFPGGKVEVGETPEECLSRELMEEFGIHVTVGEFFMSSIFHYGHGSFDLHAYLVEWEPQALTPTAHSEVSWVLPAELLELRLAPADIPIAEALALASAPASTK